MSLCSAAVALSLFSAGAHEPARVAPPSGDAADLANALMPGDYYFDVAINGYPTGKVMRFHYDGSRFSAAGRDLAIIGIEVGTAPPNESGDYFLGEIAGLGCSYDLPSLHLDLTADNRALMPHYIFARSRGPDLPPADATTGALLNYSLFVSSDDITRWRGDSFSGVSGSFEARVFGKFGTFSQSFSTALGNRNSNEFERLQTTYTYSDQHSLLTFTAGDLVSGGLPWTRPVYLGGLQLRRNFALREDLITIPTPVIDGSSAVPSTLDVYLDNARVYSSGIGAGPYQVADLPIITGAGLARVVVRGPQGQETVASLPFYASEQMLRRGLLDFSIEAGFARRGYGGFMDDYDANLVGSGSVRYGLDDRVTLTGHAEAGAGLVNGSLGATFLLGSVGTFTAAGAASSSGQGDGALASAALRLEPLRDLTLFANYERTFGDYSDLASVTSRNADPDLHFGPPDEDYRPPRETAQVSLGLPPLPWGGSLSLNYTWVERYTERSENTVGTSYSQNLFDGANLFVTGYADISDRKRYGIFAGISMSLGHRRQASVGGRVDDDGPSGSVSFTQSDNGEIGGISYALRAEAGERDYQEAWGAYRSPIARFQGAVRHDDGQMRATAQMDGTIVGAGGGVFFADRVQDSFAIVKTSAPGVMVMRENRDVGRSNKDGAVLVTDLNGYNSNRISIDPTDLPLDMDVTSAGKVVVPRSGAGVVVDFSVRKVSDAAIVAFVDANGKPIPAGMQVVVNGDAGSPALVGYDGEAFLTGLRGSNTAVVMLMGGQTCEALFDFAPVAGQQVNLGEVVCR